jgi:hypothetical protein
MARPAWVIWPRRSCKSTPVFCVRRGILTNLFCLELIAAADGAGHDPLFFEAPMSKKTRKLHGRKNPTRREGRAVRPARRESGQKRSAEAAPTAWLRIVPARMEDESGTDLSRGFFSHHNGRRQPQDLDLYTPEDNGRDR